jgi:hypothetical protein
MNEAELLRRVEAATIEEGKKLPIAPIELRSHALDS